MQTIDMVVIFKNRYFGIDFSRRDIKEITFNQAYGTDFFDWDNMICLASEDNKNKYSEMRGPDGLGFGKICEIAYGKVGS